MLSFVSMASPAYAQPSSNSVFLEDLTWVECRDAIKAGKTTAIIPTGGTEQNGPHMVLGKHNFLVKYKAGDIAKQLGNAIVAPVLAYVPEGEIPGPKPAAGHMRFPGTITIPEAVYEGILEYAARSLRAAGFVDIAFIGDSGGNQAGQKAVSEKLNKEWASTNVRVHHITDYYPGRGDAIAMANGLTMEEVGGHAGSQDTTSLLYLDPSKLRMDKFFAGKPNDGQGHTGDPRKATASIGKLIVEAQIEDATKQIQRLRVESRK
ncbi:creatininase family protein [Luteitalea sp. TBR-22]|uniref:creatininase family protein n=1 Tax=Luteitalea sp. TBR-22 TaxID=2802971 RepID=UPI001EF485C7|nr:creatininase family protein [Luteitalea sp. TBR-22]